MMRRRSAMTCCLFVILMMTGSAPLLATKQRAVRPPPTPAPAPTSFALIDFALATGQIDRDTAYLYKVYSTFDDPRLPERFRSAVPGPPDTLLMVEVAEGYDNLSPATQALLDPFFLAPLYAGSWHEQRHATAVRNFPAAPDDCKPSEVPWSVVADPASSPYPVRLWFREDHPEDGVELQLLGRRVNAIWGALSSVFHTPLADGPPEFASCRGGDGRPDIMLVDSLSSSTLGLFVPYPPAAGQGGCRPRSGYVMINRALVVNKLESTFVHELTHMFQSAYDRKAACSDYIWMDEATADWAEEFVNHTFNYEHVDAPAFLTRPALPLDLRDYAHEYGAYLFFFYTTCTNAKCTRQDPSLIRSIYETTPTRNSVDAVNEVVPGHFKEYWPLFTIFNSNRLPVHVYEREDQLKVRPPVSELGSGNVRIEAELPRLSAAYFHRDFAADPTIRSIAFLNGTKFFLSRKPSSNGLAIGENVHVIEKAPPGPAEEAHVRVLTKSGGLWQEPPADGIIWDEAPIAVYCQSATKPRLEESLLVISNSEYRPGKPPIKPPALPMTLLQSNYGCAEWKGTVRTDWPALGLTATYDLTFTNNRPSGPAPQLNNFLPFAVDGIRYDTSGTVKWNVARSAGGCTYSGSGTLTPDALATYLVTYNFVPDGPLHRRWEMQINVFTPAKVTVACQSGTEIIDFRLPPLRILRNVPLYTNVPFVDSSGTIIADTFFLGGELERWTVDLHHQP